MMAKTKRIMSAILAVMILTAVFPAPAADGSSSDITVVVTVEQFTVNGEYIIEPTLVTAPAGSRASDAVLQAVSEHYSSDPGAPDPPYEFRGTQSSGFYLEGIWDGERMLSEFSEGMFSGWVCCLDSVFLTEEASSYVLEDMTVMRWQYTVKGLGADVGNSYNGSAAANVANKDALITKIARINRDGNQSAYGTAYTDAMAVLKIIEAPQADVDAALEALEAITPAAAPSFGASHYMVLSDEIGVMFRVDYPQGFDTADSYVSFRCSDGRTGSMSFSAAKKDGNDPDSRWFTCYVNALELADIITPTLHWGDNGELEGRTYSVMEYIAAVRDKYPGEYKLLAVLDALQNYGHYLQKTNWSDGKTHNAIPYVTQLGEADASAALDGVEGMGIVKTNVGEGKPIEDVKFSLTMNAKTVINVFARPADGAEISEKADGTEQIGGQTYYRYRTGKLGPKNLGRMQTLKFTTGAGNSRVKVCAMSYVKTILEADAYASDTDVRNAMAAYYNYYAAAAEY